MGVLEMSNSKLKSPSWAFLDFEKTLPLWEVLL
jgi:hypothetical protein